jgi:hypothetical protein
MGEFENEVSELGKCKSGDEFEDGAAEIDGESDAEAPKFDGESEVDASEFSGYRSESEDCASELGGLATGLLGFGPTPPQT